jgi:uncharacterized protein YggT (Ycf19 family)
MNLVGLLNLLVDLLLVLLLVRLVVRNEGHMAFNRPYQFVVRLFDPILARLRAPERRVREFSLLAMLVLVGLRGLAWTVVGATELDYKVTAIPIWNRGYFQCQMLSLLAASVLLLQLYAFLTLAMAIGDLESRTDHYSRLMRALLGPLKSAPRWWRCLFPVLAMILFWSVALWLLPWADLHPQHPNGVVGCVLGAVPITAALYLDLTRVWIVLLIVRCVLSFLNVLLPVWRPVVIEVIERITEPALKPFRRLPLKAGQFDFTPVVAILALAVIHHLLLRQPIRLLEGDPLLRWLYQQL